MDSNILIESIESLANKFFESPLNFLYEYDLQSFLFGELFKKYDNIDFALPSKEFRDFNFTENRLTINPVKCEYPYDEIFDISIIDPKQDSKNIEDCSAIWNLDVKIAIELKYCLLGYKPSYQFMYFLKDIEKLKRYQKEKDIKDFIGIGLYFIQTNKQEEVSNFVRELRVTEIDIRNGINSYIFANGRIYEADIMSQGLK